ncbi:MAG TPA: glycosyltransferase, partial [Thermoleophilaceae bacterium]|nr:glycosyltransferase [Thermoleophilaceae bacterium]
PGTRAGRARAGRDLSMRAAPAVRSALRRAARWGATLDFYARGIAFVRGQRPDLVHCNDHNTMWIGVTARLGRGAALVYDSHELWPDRNLRPEARWWLLLAEALFVRAAHAVVMTSPAHAEVLARRYRVREPVVVRNIPARSGPAGGALAAGAGDGAAAGDGGAGEAGSSEDRERVAVYVGGLLRHRGLEESIRALAHLDGVRLRLLGPVADDYRAELEALARESGVHGRVEFAPPVPPDRVVETLRHADVGLALFQPVCLSHRLVLPNKLFEYAHAGLPMVGSDLPMITRFVRHHGVGEVVDAADVEAIAAAIRNVLRPERHDHLREAALRTGRELDWDRESELLAEVYRSALERAGS